MAKTKIPNRREVELLGLLMNGERYGRDVRDAFKKRTGEELPLGSLYTTLDRMVEKGYVKSRMGASAHARGGNRRRYFRLTGMGERAIQQFEEWAAGIVGGRVNG